MPGPSKLKRVYVTMDADDERRLKRAKELLGARTDVEAIQMCLDRVVEMDDDSRVALPPSHGMVHGGTHDR